MKNWATNGSGGGRMALEGENPHAHGVHAAGDGAAYVAIADDADSLAGDFFNVELFPSARLLVTEHAPKILGEVENGSQGKLAEGLRKDAGAIGERDWGSGRVQETEMLVESGGTGVDPANGGLARKAERSRSRGPANAGSLRLCFAVRDSAGDSMTNVRQVPSMRSCGSLMLESTRMSGWLFMDLE